MRQGKSGMGMSKHRKSGSTSYSPKLRHALSRQCGKNQEAAKKRTILQHSTVAEALKS